MTQPDFFGTPPPQESPHKQLVRLFCEAYQRQFGSKYLFSGRDAKAAKQLLDGGFQPQEVVETAEKAWAAAGHRKAFHCKAVLSLHALAARYNEVRGELAQLRNAGGMGSLNVKSVEGGEF